MAQQYSPRRGGAKQNSFFGGAAILASGILIVKVIGMFYKLPLAALLGPNGMADFTNAYNIYAVLISISTAGLPVAVSKLVSEANALDRHNQVSRVFHTAVFVFLTLGTISFLVMHFGANILANMLNDSLAAPAIRALAPAVVAVGCLAAFRGFFQGHQIMAPTAISQIIEAVIKLALGLGLAHLVMSRVFTVSDLAYYRPDLKTVSMTAEELGKAILETQTSQAAAGAITGVTVGTIIALSYMIMCYVFHPVSRREEAYDQPQPYQTVLKTLLKIAIPITISASIVGIVNVIESSLVQGLLQEIYMDANHIAKITQENLSVIEEYSRNLYGNYVGALNIYNLPLSLMAALTASVIPAISGALARKNKYAAGRILGSAMRMAALLSFPMGVGLFVLGKPIIAFMFPGYDSELAGGILSVLGIAVIAVCMVLICNAALQAYGFVTLPVVIMSIGGVVKLIACYYLVRIPSIHVRGAPFGSVLWFVLCLIADLFIISRIIPERPSYAPIFLKPAAASVVMGFVTWLVYGQMSKLLVNTKVLTTVLDGGVYLSRMGTGACLAISVLAAVIVYAIMVLWLKAVQKDDVLLMPKGEKLAKLLRL